MDLKLLEFSNLTASEQAAWIQAVGTLIAIAIAIAVPVALDQRRRRRAEKEKVSRASALLLSILPDLYKLRASTRHFLSEQAGVDADAPREIDELQGDYFSHAETFQRLLVGTPISEVYGVKLSRLVYLLFRAREMLDVITRLQASGYHAAYINNVHEFMDFASDLDAATEDLIHLVESAYSSSQREGAR